MFNKSNNQEKYQKSEIMVLISQNVKFLKYSQTRREEEDSVWESRGGEE